MYMSGTDKLVKFAGRTRTVIECQNKNGKVVMTTLPYYSNRKGEVSDAQLSNEILTERGINLKTVGVHGFWKVTWGDFYVWVERYSGYTYIFRGSDLEIFISLLIADQEEEEEKERKDNV